MVTRITNGPEQTEHLGYIIGTSLKGGEIIELASDIGGGKTTMTKGLVRGIGSEDTVTSPTFTVAKIYTGTHLKLYHYDFYRLNDPGVVGAELQEVLDDPTAVVVIEWSDIAKPLLSDRAVIRVAINKVASDEDIREVSIDIPDSFTELNHALEETK